MVSSEEVAAAVISRQPSGELRRGWPELGLGAREGGRSGPRCWPSRVSECVSGFDWLSSLLPPAPLCPAAAPMTGLLSRMNSLGPTGKAAHKLAQQMSRALGAGAGSAPGSPSAAGGGGSQLARFNSLLAAAGSASAANSAANTPQAGADRPPLSRFASRASGLAAAAAVSAATSPTAAGATAGSAQLSAQPSFTTALLAQAAAEAGASSAAAAQLDAAAWVQHFQQSQQVRRSGLAEVSGHQDIGYSCPAISKQSVCRSVCGIEQGCQLCPFPDLLASLRRALHSCFPPPPLLQGISDLQELLDLHRRYIRQASGALAGSRRSAACAARQPARPPSKPQLRCASGNVLPSMCIPVLCLHPPSLCCCRGLPDLWRQPGSQSCGGGRPAVPRQLLLPPARRGAQRRGAAGRGDMDPGAVILYGGNGERFAGVELVQSRCML